jgi:hypothetical protein
MFELQRDVRVRLKPGTEVLLLGSATFTRAGLPSDDPLWITLDTTFGDTETGDSALLEGSESVTLSLRRIVSIAGGRTRRRTFGLGATAVVESESGAGVNVSNARLTAVALPAAE